MSKRVFAVLVALAIDLFKGRRQKGTPFLFGFIKPNAAKGRSFRAIFNVIDGHQRSSGLKLDVPRLEIHDSLLSRGFSSTQLNIIASAESFYDPREPPLRIGDLVTLNSGGPVLLTVDADQKSVTVAWGRGKKECVFPRACVHRSRR